MSTIEYIRDTDGTLLGTVCVTSPFTDDERSAMAELMRFVRDKAAREDPDNLAARLIRELQQRTAKCLVRYRDNDDTIRCRRVQGHDGRHLDGYLLWDDARNTEHTGTPHDVTAQPEQRRDLS